jgi:NAD(P)-dependent dehydrogenase (short-subunit alcohol dehydrogenase family)
MDTRPVAVITGANRGIGREVARCLLATGAHVLVCARDEEAARSAARALGGAATPRQLDVTDEASVRSLAAFADAELGRVDVLVNNAGVSLDPWVPVLDVDPDVARATFEVNVQGPLRMCRTLVPLMLRNGYGRVVNVSSQLGSFARMSGRTFAYRASKAALNVLTRTLASELAGTNVLVNSACPGWARTGIGGVDAPRSAASGAHVIVELATLPDDGPTGGFFEEAGVVPW